MSKMAQSADISSGNFDFCVTFHSPANLVKATPYCFSKSLNKLYVLNKDSQHPKTKSCPVTIEANIPVDRRANFAIRSWVEFADDPYEMVQLCPAHQCTDNNNEPGGILRCCHPATTYGLKFDLSNGLRYSATIKLSNLSSTSHGPFSTALNFSFTCLSTCHSLGRRPLKLIMALHEESGDREVSRRVVDLKICACPGRDMNTEESASGPKARTLKRRAKRRRNCSRPDYSDEDSDGELLQQLLAQSSDQGSAPPTAKRRRLPSASSVGESDDGDSTSSVVTLPENLAVADRCQLAANVLAIFDEFFPHCKGRRNATQVDALMQNLIF